MTNSRLIIQVVPSPLSLRGGVSDYAKVLAQNLVNAYDLDTEFLIGSRWDTRQYNPPRPVATILHYVNYGYHARGIPWSLPRRLNALRESVGGRLVTIFHELYASSTWRRSAFWLQGLQKRVARSLAESSDLCVVSSSLAANQLRVLLRSASIVVNPVFSTFGEPPLSRQQIQSRDPRRWVICGGTELIRRSLRSFPGDKDLLVLGGDEQGDIRSQVGTDRYFPGIEAGTASELLAQCAFGWIDYFARADVQTEAILKSTSFAAYCAHAVIPVFPRVIGEISLNGDIMPGPFTLRTLPSERERPAIGQAIYDWYNRNASCAHLARSIVQVIGS